MHGDIKCFSLKKKTQQILQSLYPLGKSEQYLLLVHKFSMLLSVFAHPSNKPPPSALNRRSHDANASCCSGDDRRGYFTTRLARAEAVDASGRVSLRSTLRHRRNAPGRTRDRRHHRAPERSGRSRRRDTSAGCWLGPCIRHPDARRCSGKDDHRRDSTTRLARAEAVDASHRRVSLRSSRCHRRNTALRCSGDDPRRDFTTRLARAEAVDASGRVSLRSSSCHRRNAPGKTRDRRHHPPPEERSGHGRRHEISSRGWLEPCIRHPDDRRCSGRDGRRHYSTTRLARAKAVDASHRHVSLRSSQCHRRNTTFRGLWSALDNTERGQTSYKNNLQNPARPSRPSTATVDTRQVLRLRQTGFTQIPMQASATSDQVPHVLPSSCTRRFRQTTTSLSTPLHNLAKDLWKPVHKNVSKPPHAEIQNYVLRDMLRPLAQPNLLLLQLTGDANMAEQARVTYETYGLRHLELAVFSLSSPFLASNKTSSHYCILFLSRYATSILSHAVDN